MAAHSGDQAAGRPPPGIAVTVAKYPLLGLLSVVFLAPFYIIIRNSLMIEDQVTSLDWSWWPNPLTFDNYTDLFTDPSLPFAHALGNSLVIAVITAPLSTMMGSMAGYALARIDVPF